MTSAEDFTSSSVFFLAVLATGLIFPITVHSHVHQVLFGSQCNTYICPAVFVGMQCQAQVLLLCSPGICCLNAAVDTVASLEHYPQPWG